MTCCEVELDLETGKYEILDMVTIAESGTVVHPQGMENQLVGGAVWGIGLSGYERHLYDLKTACPLRPATGRVRCQPISIPL